MITKWIRFEVAADDAAAFRVALEELAEESKVEAGCAHYAVFADLEVEGGFRVLEQWESDAHFQAHREAVHLASFKEAWGGRILEKSGEALGEV